MMKNGEEVPAGPAYPEPFESKLSPFNSTNFLAPTPVGDNIASKTVISPIPGPLQTGKQGMKQVPPAKGEGGHGKDQENIKSAFNSFFRGGKSSFGGTSSFGQTPNAQQSTGFGGEELQGDENDVFRMPSFKKSDHKTSFLSPMMPDIMSRATPYNGPRGDVA